MLSPLPDPSLVPADARVLAAVSGGADSCALLWWLRELGRDVVAGHVNHKLDELRNGECDRDEAFVRERCEQWGIPLSVATVDLPRRNNHVHEEVARNARYAALVEMAREADCSLIATGHTATDGLETALLNMLRGAGVRGLAGIPPRREVEPGLTVIRPFWALPREGTREMLREAGWNWLEDASNTSALFRRNRIRHEVLPLLAEISGRDVGELSRQHAKSGQIQRDDLEVLEVAARDAFESVVHRRTADVLILDGPRLLALPVGLQRRCLRLAQRESFGSEGSFTVTENVRTWATQGGRRKVWCLPAGARLEWTGAGSGNLFRFWTVASET